MRFYMPIGLGRVGNWQAGVNDTRWIDAFESSRHCDGMRCMEKRSRTTDTRRTTEIQRGEEAGYRVALVVVEVRS
jgi:hypothetical protein